MEHQQRINIIKVCSNIQYYPYFQYIMQYITVSWDDRIINFTFRIINNANNKNEDKLTEAKLPFSLDRIKLVISKDKYLRNANYIRI